MLEALILDVDGTLAETERDGHRVAFNRAFAEFGLDWYWDVATYGKLLRVAGGRERIRHYLRVWHPPMPGVPDVDAFVEDLHAAKTGHFGRIVATGMLRPRPGVLRLLAEAQARGVALGLASSTSPRNVEALLEAWFPDGWRCRFAAVGAGGTAWAKKPDPGVYRWVLQRLGADAPRCVAFEDSAAGCAAAAAAGVPTVVTRSEYFRDDRFDRALAVLDGLGEPGAPAAGRAADLAWSGVVDLDTLEAWRVAGAVRLGRTLAAV